MNRFDILLGKKEPEVKKELAEKGLHFLENPDYPYAMNGAFNLFKLGELFTDRALYNCNASLIGMGILEEAYVHIMFADPYKLLQVIAQNGATMFQFNLLPPFRIQPLRCRVLSHSISSRDNFLELSVQVISGFLEMGRIIDKRKEDFIAADNRDVVDQLDRGEDIKPEDLLFDALNAIQ